MNALFLSRDLFNLYVTLELVGLAAVALTAMRGQREALVAAMRYLLTTLLGSMTYLLAVALLYTAPAAWTWCRSAWLSPRPRWRSLPLPPWRLDCC